MNNDYISKISWLTNIWLYTFNLIIDTTVENSQASLIMFLVRNYIAGLIITIISVGIIYGDSRVGRSSWWVADDDDRLYVITYT